MIPRVKGLVAVLQLIARMYRKDYVSAGQALECVGFAVRTFFRGERS